MISDNEDIKDLELYQGESSVDNSRDSSNYTKKKIFKLTIAKDRNELIWAIVVMGIFVLNTVYMVLKWVLHHKLS